MIRLIAVVAYVSFAALTAALIWAMSHIAKSSDRNTGENPHSWRF